MVTGGGVAEGGGVEIGARGREGGLERQPLLKFFCFSCWREGRWLGTKLQLGVSWSAVGGELALPHYGFTPP